MSAAQPSTLFAELGFAVLTRVAKRVFMPLGRMPEWWSFIDTNSSSNDPFVPSSRHPFLQSFLDEAEEFWINPQETRHRVSSAIWEVSEGDEQLYVQVIALKLKGDCLLVFHNVDATGEGRC